MLPLRVWHAGLLQKLKSYGISGQIFGCISSFLSNQQLQVVLVASLQKNIQLMMEFFKLPFLFLHFSCYTLMTFLMLFVILLSMLMILLSILSVIRHLICCDNLNWLLNFNLICKTLLTGARSGLLISMLGKLNWFRLTNLIALVLLMWKWMGLVLRKINLLRCWGWPYLLNWISIAKTASKKTGTLIHSMKFLSPDVALYLYKCTICPRMEYCCTSGLVPLVACWNC